MELILQKAEGVPENGVLSIKVGETKRQGPVSKIGQPFRFSSSLAEPLPMKVEILTQAAPEQNLKLDPMQSTVDIHFGGDMKLTLGQREAPELKRPLADVKDMTKSTGIATDKLHMAQSAAAYLEQYDLVRTFQDILHGLLISKPADPFAYLEEHVARAKALGSADVTPSPPTVPLHPRPVPPAGPAPPPRPGAASHGSSPAPSKQCSSPRSASSKNGARASRRISAVSENKVEALLEILHRTSKNLPLILPLLPLEFQEMLTSQELEDECKKQFKALDSNNTGKLVPAQLVPVIVQLSTANEHSVSAEMCKKFVDIFDSNEDGAIQNEEFTMLTQFVIIAAHLETPEGQTILAQAEMEEKRFEELLAVLEADRDRLIDVIPFLPDWLVMHLSSEKFMEECEARFEALDVDGSGTLEPLELLPVVLKLSKANPATVNHDKCRRFVQVFDVYGTGVIARDEFIDFAQFMAVVNFLNTTVEGYQVATASMDYADHKQICEDIRVIKEDPKKLDAAKSLPKGLQSVLMSKTFASRCKEGFIILDKSRRGVLDFESFYPVLQKLCADYPVKLDEQSYKEYMSKYDKEKRGTVSIGKAVELARYVVALGYLCACRDWHDRSVKNSRERIEELLYFLKAHKDQIADIIPFLPGELKDELVSPEFAENCKEEFKRVDKDGSGVLEPKELIPLILQLSEAHQLALDYDHVLEFVALFDTLKNGVLTLTEFIEFAGFMVIVGYLESADGRVVQEVSEIYKGPRQVDDLLLVLQQDRKTIHKVIPLLPQEVFDEITSPQLIANCQERFARLDVDKNGVLSPEELFPIVVDLAQAHPYAINQDHCVNFTKIFDVRGDGVIHEDEFIEFARFLCIMSYLQSAEGQEKVTDAFKILDDSQMIEDLLAQLKADKKHFRKIMPYLPEDMQDELLSKRFASKCTEKFKKLDKDDNGTLDPIELFPVVLEMAHANQYALDFDQCKRFTAIFDDEKTGVISRQEFVNLARFLLVMSYLQTEDGKKVLQTALAAYDEDKEKRRMERVGSKEVAGMKTKLSPQEKPPPTGEIDTRMPTAGEIVASGSEAKERHLMVELDFYQQKADKLTLENEALRTKTFELEERLRRVEASMEEQAMLLKHAEIELQSPARKKNAESWK
jgi:Ca2+-binding EF-hand superfamily protein